MYELVQVAPRTYYINSPSKVGVYVEEDNSVWLIDSGNDKDAGRKIQKRLEENGWTLKAIINTHSNADHIGGNTLLQNRLQCQIYATPMENAVIGAPILEPSFLYGGYPFQKLRNKFLMATPSRSQDIAQAELPEGMEILPLGGHFWQMIGVRTPDDIYFLADCVFGENIVEKYHISFVYDAKAFLETLEFVKTLEGKLCIPAHAEPTEHIAALAEVNQKKTEEILEHLLSICQTPKNFEVILQEIFTLYGLTMDYGQYVLVGSTIRSYLSYLFDAGKVEAFVENSLLLWKTI